MNDLDAEKARLRADLRQRRKSLSVQQREAASEAVAQRFLDNAGILPPVVAGYWPVGSELDPRPLMHRLIHAGVTVALPVVAALEAPLLFRAWLPTDLLIEGRFGLEPPSDRPMLVPDLLLTPLLGFDADLYRLGQGGGFYDRTMALYPACRRVGLAFGCQEVPLVPRGPFDLPLHAMITERKIIGRITS
ncbi:5-formyltetrahydrofolate cyclo-ligase [Lacibacterium aquatile]|uniref:5-formyltetrahydrofolate cyclo-ligase n=1 Tax=Lacibacterium aquatile TaxID=1168082 RepID=A0ABW5DSR2_9PROT